MASPEEHRRLVDTEMSASFPLDVDGIQVAQAAEAITRGEHIKTVNDKGHTKFEATARKMLPWALAAVNAQRQETIIYTYRR